MHRVAKVSWCALWCPVTGEDQQPAGSRVTATDVMLRIDGMLLIAGNGAASQLPMSSRTPPWNKSADQSELRQSSVPPADKFEGMIIRDC
jgi:hypothetical protein